MRLPVVTHDAVESPADLVRCDRFGAVLSAAACAARSLAPQRRHGFRHHVLAGVARYAPCAACPFGAEARRRLALAGSPGRPEVLVLRDPDNGESPPPPRRRPKPLSPRDEAFLLAHDWTRDGARWRDQHGEPYRPEVAIELAHRDCVYRTQGIGPGRRRATDQVIVVSKPRAA